MGKTEDRELLDRLMEPDEWIAALAKSALNHSSIDIEDEQLPDGFELHDITLRKANLRGIRCRGLKITRCHLRAVDLSGAYLPLLDIRDSTLHQTNFDRSEMEGAKFSYCVGVHTSFIGTQLQYSRWASSRLRRAICTGASFARCSMTDTDFDYSNCAGASFRLSHIAQSSFAGACLVVAEFAGAYVGNNTNFEGADLSGVTIRDDMHVMLGLKPLAHITGVTGYPARMTPELASFFDNERFSIG